MASKEIRLPVSSVVHALKILRHLSEAKEAEGVTAIARQLGISPSSCFNLLRTLAAEEFANFDPARKTYSIGPELARLVKQRDAEDPVVAMALPHMERLAAHHGIASGLWRLEVNRRLVLVAVAESDVATRLHMTPGQRLPRLIGAIGRCVAAYATLSEEAMAAEFARLRWERPPTLARYKREIAVVRKQGWARDEGDFMRGLTTIAAPIQDAKGAVRYCIANTLFAGQFGPEGIAELGAVTADTALAIARHALNR